MPKEPMKIVSFNVNSVRQRLHQLQVLVDEHSPEIIGLQETKVTDPDFPVADIEALGYKVTFQGQKTHYGVAILSKEEPLQVIKGFSTDEEDAQRRWIGIEYPLANGESLHLYNGYFPQGEARDHPIKFPAKERFYADILSSLGDHTPTQNLLLIGDFNVAPVDADIGIGPDNAKRWLRGGKTSFLPEEREWLQRLADWGLTDTYRHLYPDNTDYFSWFDYRSKGFDRDPKRGLRIDHLYASAPLMEKLQDSGMEYGIRAMTKPSDHCPVWSSFNLQARRST